MTYNSTTTLNLIRAERPCQSGWLRLLEYLGKAKADDEPLSLLTVLDSNGLVDALWVLSYAMPNDRLARHFQAWCAEQALHFFEAEYPGDNRIRDQIAMLRNDDAAPEERIAARAAARAAAGNTSRDAARDASWAAVRAVIWDAVRAAARAAARDAARDAQEAAAWDAAWDAARDAQEAQLRAMIAEQQEAAQ